MHRPPRLFSCCMQITAASSYARLGFVKALVWFQMHTVAVNVFRSPLARANDEANKAPHAFSLTKTAHFTDDFPRAARLDSLTGSLSGITIISISSSSGTCRLRRPAESSNLCGWSKRRCKSQHNFHAVAVVPHLGDLDVDIFGAFILRYTCLLYTSPSPRD